MSIRFETVVKSSLVVQNHEIARDHKRLVEEHIRLIQIMSNSVTNYEFS